MLILTEYENTAFFEDYLAYASVVFWGLHRDGTCEFWKLLGLLSATLNEPSEACTCNK